ncbi:hypothetical protein BV898_10091 [Hypsibius exemplaris]|uniref:DDE Tnp4 domain-containing protein n=1 Tax=Hypsibius exemplaris TaxID=2072580 RepID=A0A1W0WKM6_HYPEX|nr:hypothetical protein BV898_10091 [Hypsibius exemplaris]
MTSRRTLKLAYAAGLLSTESFILLWRRKKDRFKHKYQAKKFSFEKLSGETCKDDFRLEKADIKRLADLLNMPKKFHLASRLIVSSLEVLCIVLRRLSYPGRLRDLQTFFPRHHTTLSRIFNFGLNWIYEKTHHLIDTLQQPFLTRERMDQYAAVIANESGHLSRGMRIFAFIDGTFKQTCRPDKDQRVIYNGKDRHHGLKYQGITAPDGLILHLAGPFEGARHDAYTYLESSIEDALRAKMEDVGRQFRLYGDPAYTLSNFLITPFRKATAQGEIDFNQIMASVRIAVEWSFGKVVQLYAFNDFRKNLKIDLQPVAKMFIV